MDNQWKCETCGTCDFVTKWSKKSGRCRRLPPQVFALFSVDVNHPLVHRKNDACFLWRKKENK